MRSPSAFPATKFVPPTTGLAALHRERCLGLLTEGEHRPVTIIRGLPGSGKTTLVSDWVARWRGERPERRTSVWVSCDAGDQDPVTLWSAVVAALEPVVPFERDAVSAPIFDGTPEQAAAVVVNALMNRADRGAAEEVVLVIDEAERAGEAIATLVPLVERVPSGVRIVFTSRVEVPLPLQQLRVRRLVWELQPADLDLTLEETRELLGLIEREGPDNARGMPDSAAGTAPGQAPPLDETTLRALHRTTEGWLAPYVLATADAGQHLDGLVAADREVGDGRIPGQLLEFFRDTFAAQPVSMQNFLLEIALLDEYTVADCRAIIDAHSGDELLRVADARGLFVKAGRAPGSHSLHPLFRQFLRQERTGRDPQDDVELHRRAASWYASEGRHRLAVSHHLAAGDLVLALRTLGAQLWNTGLACGTPELNEWLGELDDDAVRTARSAEALAVYGLAQIAAGDVMRGGRWLRVVEREREAASREGSAELSRNSSSIDGAGSKGVQQMAALGWLTIAWRDGDLAAAAEHLDHLRRLRDHAVRWPSVLELVLTTETCTWLDDHDGARQVHERRIGGVDGSSVDDVFVTSAYAYTCAVEGRLATAAGLADAALERAQSLGVGEQWPMDAARGALGLIAYEQGRYDDAREILSGILQRSQGIPSHLLLARAALARIELAEGAVEPSLSTIKTPTGVPLGNGGSPLRDHLVAVDVRAALAVGDLARAHDLIRHVQNGWRATLLRARVALAAARLGDATEALEELEGIAVPDTPRVQVDVLAVRARLARKRKEEAEAQRLLAAALELAVPETLVRPFFEDGPELWPALRRLLSSWPRQPFHGVASEMANRGRSSHRFQLAAESGSTPSVFSSLRPREIEVLRLIGQRLSNAEIAAALFISPNTLKTHTRALYRKLGVTNRAEAIDAAERFHIY